MASLPPEWLLETSGLESQVDDDKEDEKMLLLGGFTVTYTAWPILPAAYIVGILTSGYPMAISFWLYKEVDGCQGSFEICSREVRNVDCQNYGEMQLSKMALYAAILGIGVLLCFSALPCKIRPVCFALATLVYALCWVGEYLFLVALWSNVLNWEKLVTCSGSNFSSGNSGDELKKKIYGYIFSAWAVHYASVLFAGAALLINFFYVF
eukprot:jgi/Bigna1/140413/aug1.56_g15121